MKIFTDFISPIDFKPPPPPVQKYSGPEKILRKHIYTKDKILWSLWISRTWETYLQQSIRNYSGATSNTGHET